MLPAHDRAVTHPEQHADRVIAVPGVADHVGVAGADDLDADRLLQPLQPAERVPKLLGALEVLPLAGREHRLPDPHPHVLRPPLEELHHVVTIRRYRSSSCHPTHGAWHRPMW